MANEAAPSWLSEGASSTPAAAEPEPSPAPTPAPEGLASAPAAKSASSPPTDNIAGSIMANASAGLDANTAAPSAVDEAALSKAILMMRVLNMAAAVLLVTTSVLQMVGIPHISVWIMSIYASCGGLLVCCLETQLKFVRTVIAMNFGFLFNSVYRAIFYCLMASVTWSYGGILGFITSGVLIGTAVFNTFVLCRYPAYRKMREQVAAEEDKRIQSKINQQVRKQAVSNMGWGKN